MTHLILERKNSMSLQKLQHTMESFFLSTHLSICALDKNHKLQLVTGASTELISFIDPDHSHNNADFFNEILEYTHKQLEVFDTEDHLVYSPQEAIHFSICPIQVGRPSEGLYLIGPYTSELSLRETYLFKPDHCIKPLIQLLYVFYQGPLEKECIENNLHCNFHITKALEYIDKHAHEPISLSELANFLDINKSYLCTLFKKCTNDCFSTYLNKVRIEKSKRLLKETTHSILDIALQVGFSNASYYNTLFKKHTGITPLADLHQIT